MPKFSQAIRSEAQPDWKKRLPSWVRELADPEQPSFTDYIPEAGPLIAKMPFPVLRDRARKRAAEMHAVGAEKAAKLLYEKYPRVLGHLDEVTDYNNIPSRYTPSKATNTPPSHLNLNWLETVTSDPVDLDQIAMHEVGHLADDVWNPDKLVEKIKLNKKQLKALDKQELAGKISQRTGQALYEHLPVEKGPNLVKVKKSILWDPDFKGSTSQAGASARRFMHYVRGLGIPIDEIFNKR